MRLVRKRSINSALTIALFQMVFAANPDKGCIHIYCDRVTYYVSKQVSDWVVDKPIQLHFLSSYSPNLNPIEPLWKYMQGQVIDSIYSTLAEFRTRIRTFLGQLEPYSVHLKHYMALKFAIVQN